MSRIGQSQPSGTYFTLRQANPARFRKLYTQSYTVLHVLSGSKRIFRTDGSQVQVTQGDFVLFRAGESLTFENQPSDCEMYRAEGISFRPAFVEEFVANHGAGTATKDTERRRFQSAGDSLAAFDHAKDGLTRQSVPAAVIENRLREVLIWVAHAGVRLVLEREQSLGERVRHLIQADLEHRWRVGAVAKELAVSEATLRRRLAEEGSSFSDILQDARLSHALDLLMTTETPITEISYSVGFSSPSTFSKSFRDRFELTPREIRTPAGRNDRIRTELDRAPKVEGPAASYS